ncbi:MAG: hypothetical protein L0177_08450 [Chloroflexi bacterium]|nr:hypothetical protein [Chloroflexota bacterium]
MPIENRELKVGTKLFARYKRQEYRAEVVEGEEGKRLYRLADGRTFKSPSATGTAITGKACNGWMFWSVEESYEWADEGPSDETASAGEDAGQQEGQGEEESRPAVKRTPNQRGVSEGSLRPYCDACAKSFEAPAGEQPQTCPQGHRPGEAQQQVSES